MFKTVTNNKERNKQILNAYTHGYSQYKIAEVLGFSQAYINQIIQKVRKHSDEVMTLLFCILANSSLFSENILISS